MSAVTDWLTAIGTCGAVIVSLGLALREIRARRKQEEQEQAEQITAWLVPLPDAYRDQYPSETCMGIRVHNASNQVIYDVIAEIVIGRKTAVGDTLERNKGFGAMIGNVPPGGFTTPIETGGGMLGRRHSIELAFQDAGGRYWLRRGNGRLQRVTKSPLELFKLVGAASWHKSV
jgi:hypothetical protein